MNELIHLDPAKLTTDKNVRKDLNLTKEFLASVKNSGVLEPIVAYPDPITDGTYRIHLGHRRAAAAVEGGLVTVPVYVISEREAADRIAEQLVENVHRSALKPVETAEAYKELSLFGLPATAIAKKTSTKLAAVGNAIKVANNEIATKVLQERQLTIDEALVFTEFVEDPDAVARLEKAAAEGRLTHAAQVIRVERIEAKALEALRVEAEASGLQVLDSVPSYDDPHVRAIGRVYESADEGAEPVTLEIALAQARDDVHVYIKSEWTPFGEPTKYGLSYAITNWADHGWYAIDYGKPANGPLTDEEKAERKTARENAKLWSAATTVRHNWVKDFLKRRTLPNDIVTLPALLFANRDLVDYRTRRIAAQLLELEEDYNALKTFIATAPNQSAHVITALAVAGFELNLDPKRGWQTTDDITPLYLRQLSAWGYPLSELEENLVNGAKLEDAA
jgi:ParB family chromosome partitioning protein